MSEVIEVRTENLKDLKAALVRELPRAGVPDVKVRTWDGLLTIDTPLKKLVIYHFECKPDMCIWRSERFLLRVQLTAFDVAQRAKGAFWSLRLSEAATESAMEQSITDLWRRHRSPIRKAFVLRSLRAISLLEGLQEPALENAVAAPTDQGVIVKALQNEEALAPVRELDPLLSARLRGIAAKQKLLESWGGSVSVAEAAAVLGMTRQALDKRRREGKLLAVELGKRGYYYPVWQLQLQGMSDVLKTLAPRDPWTQLSFFANPNDLLGDRTPIECLKAGEIEKVVKAAAEYGEHGA